MSTPTPPGPDEPVLDSFAAEEPTAPTPAAAPAAAPADDVRDVGADEQPEVLDSFAAETPAEPADAATGASTPAELPSPPADVPGTLGSPPAAEPEQIGAGARGSEGLTTAPPPLSAPPAEEPASPPAPLPADEPVAHAPVEPPRADEPPAAPVPSTEPAAAAAPSADPGPTAPVEPAAAPTAEAAPRRSRAWLPLTAVGLAVALLAGATGWLAWQLRQQDRADQASVEAVAAARDAARLLFSYDHKTLQADFDKGLAVTTGDFRKQYSRTTKDVVSPVAVQYKAVVKAEVVEAAVIDAQADAVTALVFLNQATTSTRVQGQQVDQSRVRMRLVPRGGRWLVEEVKAL